MAATDGRMGAEADLELVLPLAPGALVLTLAQRDDGDSPLVRYRRAAMRVEP